VERILIGETSEVLIGEGLPHPLLPTRPSRGKSVILTQPGSIRLAAELASSLVAPVFELPDREEAKSLATLGQVYEWLAAQDVGRHDTIIGVGGGAATDLAGFAAATWLRGVEVVHIPTTLLGAVDAAIGGKTGINLAGKNLVGAFHQPSRVIIDLEILQRLPDDLKLEGLAESLKAGLVGDPLLVDLFTRDGPSAPLGEVVTRAVRVKAEVVTEDPEEAGRRAILNFGHTIGHGVEVVTGLPHGLAVAVGMVAAGAVSARRFGFPAQWLAELIFSLGLPVACAGASAPAVLELIYRDKKRVAAGLRMVLLRGVGDPVLEVVDEAEVGAGLAAIGIT
jgi:3-dehydroquinate synthase